MSDTAEAGAPSAQAAATDTAVDTESASQGTPNVLGAPQGTSNSVKEAAAEAMKKYKVKVDGKELEVDERELLRGYSHQQAANKILQEGKQARKQAEEFIGMMKDKGKLFEVIQKLGHDPRKLTEEYLAAQLEEEMLDPREREFRQTQKKLKTYEEQEQQRVENLRREQESIRAKQLAEEYSNQFVEALTTTGLPKTKETISKMATYVHRSAQLGIKITADEAAKLVRDDYQKAVSSIAGSAEGEMLIKLLGDDIANKIRKWDTSRVRTPEDMLRTPAEQNHEPRKKQNGAKPMTHREWKEFNRK